MGRRTNALHAKSTSCPLVLLVLRRSPINALEQSTVRAIKDAWRNGCRAVLYL